MIDSKQRFSDRVADYIKFRPKYPPQIIELLQNNIGLTSNSIIADIGAGTGFLTELFLKNANYVYAVEPNAAMRMACGELYGKYPNLKIVDASAEATTLFNDSIDIVVAAQAFHWFDKTACKKEFERVLKSNGHIVLIWNARKDSSSFSKGYDDILVENIPEYKTLDHRNVDDKVITAFFNPRKMNRAGLPNKQFFNWDEFKGRALSSSYVPKAGNVHDRIMHQLKSLFDGHAKDGRVIFEYDTTIFWNE